MESHNANPNATRRSVARTLTVLAAALLLTLTAVPGVGVSDVNARVLPIDSQPYGKSYGEWAVAYWQWAFGIPFDQNPWLNDPTGVFAGVGQSGSVWFLGGTGGTSAERSLTIPSGKAIFMPINQWIFGATAFDCDPTVPGVPCDVPTLQDAAAAAVDAAKVVEVTIDGQRVGNERDYRAASPGSFSVTLPDGNFQGLAPGTYAPHVADGYWLMLTPLPAGEHTIEVNVVHGFGFQYYITYHITVAGRTNAPANLSPGQSENAAPAAGRTSWGRVKAIYR